MWLEDGERVDHADGGTLDGLYVVDPSARQDAFRRGCRARIGSRLGGRRLHLGSELRPFGEPIEWSPLENGNQLGDRRIVDNSAAKPNRLDAIGVVSGGNIWAYRGHSRRERGRSR